MAADDILSSLCDCPGHSYYEVGNRGCAFVAQENDVIQIMLNSMECIFCPISY